MEIACWSAAVIFKMCVVSRNFACCVISDVETCIKTVLIKINFTIRAFVRGKCNIRKELNTLRTGLLNCLNALSRGLNFRHRESCI